MKPPEDLGANLFLHEHGERKNSQAKKLCAASQIQGFPQCQLRRQASVSLTP